MGDEGLILYKNHGLVYAEDVFHGKDIEVWRTYRWANPS